MILELIIDGRHLRRGNLNSYSTNTLHFYDQLMIMHACASLLVLAFGLWLLEHSLSIDQKTDKNLQPDRGAGQIQLPVYFAFLLQLDSLCSACRYRGTNGPKMLEREKAALFTTGLSKNLPRSQLKKIAGGDLCVQNGGNTGGAEAANIAQLNNGFSRIYTDIQLRLPNV